MVCQGRVGGGREGRTERWDTETAARTCSLVRLRGKTELLDCGRKYEWRWARAGREGAAHLALPFPPLACSPAHLPAHSLPKPPSVVPAQSQPFRLQFISTINFYNDLRSLVATPPRLFLLLRHHSSLSTRYTKYTSMTL